MSRVATASRAVLAFQADTLSAFARPVAPPRLTEITGFGTNPGRLKMFAYVPQNLPRHAPLVVVLHGCRQNAEDYERGAGWTHMARERGFALLFAEQRRANNPNVCFNWFRPSNVTRDRGEVGSIRQMITRMVALYKLDRRRIFITGLSAGGAMTAAMISAYPELFAGAGIIAGLPFGAARDVSRAIDAMRAPPQRTAEEWGDLVRKATGKPLPKRLPTVSIWHGTDDRTVTFANAEALLAQWRDVHGLSAEAGRTEKVDGHQRTVWADAKGQPRVTLYRIEGMDHGTPLKAGTGPRAREIAGDYMLDAGISSTRHLADAWGLKKPTLAAVLSPGR
ncbi:PHB depolymerase family esterase [Rhizobium sp. RU20A]|uniref:extracellular catalytic domain type 1 short-chain-length polyhydroxyalkanoate depolymerase n=1 Tax=Rhizobium sp. RU20A TaxID=1907412 RepID=UPI001FCE813B|nr:PHB depolymerase family esterase [Rhizobium sp. RU20A]